MMLPMFFKRPKRLSTIPKKILLIRPDAIGDMVLMIPVLKAIRRDYPTSHITVLSSAYNARVINHLTLFDDIMHKTKPKSLKEFLSYISFLRKQKFDVAIHFGVRSYIAWPCFFSVPVNIGDKSMLGLWPVFRKYGVFYRNHNRFTHVVDYHFILSQALNLTRTEEDTLTISPPKGTVEWAKDTLDELGVDRKKPIIGIQVGVGFGNRPIRPEKYAQYITLLKQQLDVEVCVCGYSEQELDACRVIMEQAQGPVHLLEKIPIESFMGMISCFSVFVSVDTGPFHLGAALGVPQLAIFPSKKVKPLSWGPYRNRHIVMRNNTECLYDCPHQGCPYDICSDDIPESAMVDQTQVLLKGGGVSSKEDQIDHWFTQCMSILVIFDADTVKAADVLFSQLRSWGLHVYSININEGNVFECIRQRDIAIVHNLTGKHRLNLFLLGQKAIKYIHHSPLLIHDVETFETKEELLDFYREKFNFKII